MLKYNCPRCEFCTSNKYNFIRHLTRKYKCSPINSNDDLLSIAKFYGLEHEMNQNEPKRTKMNQNESNEPKMQKNEPKMNQNEPKMNQNEPALFDENQKLDSDFKFICQYCQKSFNTKPSMRRHQIHRCIYNKDQSDLLKRCKKQIKNANINYNNSNNNSSNHSINLSNNQYNTTNNIINQTNNIVITNFGSENIEYISKRFLDKLVKAPFTSIQKLLRCIHFNPAHPENHNVRITNKKERFANIYKDNKWFIEDKKKIINDMVEKGFDIIDDHHNEIHDQLDNYKQRNFQRFKDKYDDPILLKNLEQNIEIDILNNSKIKSLEK